MSSLGEKNFRSESGASQKQQNTIRGGEDQNLSKDLSERSSRKNGEQGENVGGVRGAGTGGGREDQMTGKKDPGLKGKI